MLQDRKFLTEQVKRLSALRGWRDLEREGRSELVTALAQNCKSLQHARAVIDAALADKQYVPTPAEIKMLAESTPDPGANAPKARASCIECGGTGWRHFWALATWKLDSAGRPVGKAAVTEIPRPAHVTIAEWIVSGNRIAKAGDGQEIYSMVERCHCTRS